MKDGAIVTFGDTGYSLYESKELPDEFSWELTAIKLNDNTRDIGAEMTSVVNDKGFDPFAKSLPALIGAAANPAFTAAIEVSKFILNVVGNSLAHKKDRQLGLLYMSLNRFEHYPHGTRDKQNIGDMTGNMWVDYTVFDSGLAPHV